MLWLAITLKLLAEVALMALLGQWLLGWLAGPGRERNLAYQVLAIVTAPVRRAAGRLAGPGGPDGGRAHAVAAFGLLLLWLAALALKVHACLAVGVQACR